MTTIREEQKLTILKHLAGGKSLDVVATVTHVDRNTVGDVARSHGYPDKDKLAWAADILDKRIAEERTTRLPQGDPRLAAAPAPRATVPPTQVPSPTVPPPAQQPTTPGKPDEFRVLINTAKNHDRKGIQRLAEKILDDCAKLRGLIDAEATAYAARQAAARQKADARAEVDRLQAQLAEARAKLHSTKTPATRTAPVAGATDSAAIRAWARETGLDCPKVGRLPASIREAYEAAHTEQAAAS